MAKKKSRRKFNAGYQPLTGAPLVQRIAHFLDWGAKNHPRVYFQYNEVLKAVNGYDYTPRLDNKEIVGIKSAMTRVKKVLLDRYGRGFHAERSIGVRATVDSEDATKFDLTGKIRRRVSMDKAIVEVGTKAIDSSKFSGTAEGKALAAVHREAMKAVDPQLEERLNKLLPPAPKKGKAP